MKQNSFDFIKEVLNLKINHYNGFLAENERIISDYNNEIKTSNDYNGRQILELLQNAEDAKASKVIIELNKSQKKIVISNNGEPFISKGIGSLMISDNSPKPKWENIGNKGLGFRSVIAWCNKVVIKSSGCFITFSRDIAEKFFKSPKDTNLKVIESENISVDEIKNINERINKAGLGWTEEQINEYNESHHKGNSICFPLFGMPNITIQEEYSSWTSIELFYKDSEKIEDQIEEQLSNNKLSEENLLFLNNIKLIKVIGNSESKEIHKTTIPDSTKKYGTFQYEEMKINNQYWQVLRNEGAYEHEFEDMPKGKTIKYSTMIAWNKESPKKEYPLYCYFPTEIKISLPFVMHGTFELDSARNHLVNEIDFDNNSYIFNKIGRLIETAIEIIKDESNRSNWKAYEFIDHPQLVESLSCLTEILSTIKQSKKIYPSVFANEYLKKEDYIYYTDNFSLFAEKNFSEDFRYMIRPGKEIEHQIYAESYPNENKKGIIGIINTINSQLNTYELRAKFIGVLSELKNIAPNWNFGHLFPLLINQEGVLISIGKTGYINKKEVSNTVNLPFYVKFELVNSALSKLLYENVNYSEALKNDPKREDRALKNTLNVFINISEYDLARITEGVINQVKEAIDSGKEKNEVIKAETSFLYYEYYKSKDEEKLSSASSRYKPRFLNINNEVEFASKLYFSPEFGTIGQEIHDIWDNSITNDELLLFNKDNGIPLNSQEEITEAIGFYKYFGVNSFLTIRDLQISEGKVDQYTSSKIAKSLEQFIISQNRRITPSTKSSFSYISNIKKIEKINDLSTILIILLKSGEEIKQKINNESLDFLRFEKLNTTFINYQLRQLHKFDNSFASKNTGILFKLLNNYSIDIERIKKITSKNYGEIFQFLQNLGCKTELSQYRSDFLYDFMNKFDKIAELKDGKNVSTLYTEIVKALAIQNETNRKKALNEKDMYYWVNYEGKRKFLSSKENKIYYFENKILPEHYLKQLKIICIPFRKGSKKVPAMLGIKGKEDWSITIGKINENKIITSQFRKKMDILKPLILKYRFNSEMAEDTREEEASKLNKFEIIFVKKLPYSINGNPDILTEYEFIQHKNIFYYKIANETSIEEICQQKVFLDAFAEMLSICFELTDDTLLDSFRLLAAYSEDEVQRKMDTDPNFASAFEEYSKYFDISNTHEYKFWESVLSLIGKDITKLNFKTVNELNNSVMKELELDMECPNLYFLNKEEHISLLNQIQKKTSINIKTLLKKIGKNIESYNTSKLENQIKLYEKQFLFKLWCKLVKNNNLQAKFVDYRDFYLNALFKDIFLEELQYNLTFNAEKVLKDFILNDSRFSFKLNSEEDNDKIPSVRIRHFYKQFEEYVNQPKNDYRFYFSGYKNELEKLKIKANEHSALPPNENELQFEEEWGTASEKIVPESKIKSKRHGGSHTKKTEKDKLKKGTKAEEAIISWFKKIIQFTGLMINEVHQIAREAMIHII